METQKTDAAKYKTAFLVLETDKGTLVANAIDFKDATVSLQELLPIEHEATSDDLDRIISEIFMYRASQSEAIRKMLMDLISRAIYKLPKDVEEKVDAG